MPIFGRRKGPKLIREKRRLERTLKKAPKRRRQLIKKVRRSRRIIQRATEDIKSRGAFVPDSVLYKKVKHEGKRQAVRQERKELRGRRRYAQTRLGQIAVDPAFLEELARREAKKARKRERRKEGWRKFKAGFQEGFREDIDKALGRGEEKEGKRRRK